MFCCPKSGLQAVGNPDFVINVVKVSFDRISADVQFVGNFGVADTGGNKKEHFFFSGSQQIFELHCGRAAGIGVKKAFLKVSAGVPQLSTQDSRHALCQVWQGIAVVEDPPDTLFNQVVSKRLIVGHIKKSNIIAFLSGIEKRSDFGP